MVILQFSGRVGRTQKICLPERIRRAVIAHLRHRHTDYDQMLMREATQRAKMKSGDRQHEGKREHATKAVREKARQMVSKRIKQIWQSWDPPTQSPWDALGHKDKAEFLLKGEAKAKLVSDKSDEDDGWAASGAEEEEEAEEGSDEEDDECDWRELGLRRDGQDSTFNLDEEVEKENNDDLIAELCSDAESDIPAAPAGKRTIRSKSSTVFKKRKSESDTDSGSNFDTDDEPTNRSRRITRSVANGSTALIATDRKAMAVKPNQRGIKRDAAFLDDEALYSRPSQPIPVPLSSGAHYPTIRSHVKAERPHCMKRPYPAKAENPAPEVIYISD
jgi:hypothetical protein